MTDSHLPCFKAYDIRGRVPDELDEALAERIAAGASGILGEGPVVIGHDIRLSSPALLNSLSKGFQRSGRDIIDIGLCGTEEVYFQTFDRQAAGGVMVTASHNPMDYNGMKLVRDQSKPISGDSGLFAIRDFTSGKAPLQSLSSQLIVDHNKSRYIDHLLGYVANTRMRPLRIVTNAGNGGAGLIIDQLSSHLPFEFIRIQHEPDGSFPNGIPNPLLPTNRTATAEAVRQHNADFGIAWDGDFDRCFFFDGSGNFIEGYYIVGLLATAMLGHSPGGKIIHDPRLIWNTVDMVESAGGTPIISKTGHAFIKERMRAEDAIYGGEMSAHHYFRDFSYCDSGMIPWLLIAGLVSETGIALGDMVKDRIDAFPCSGEINFSVRDTGDAIASTVDHYSRLDPHFDYTDGISADFGAWRFNLRSSNTEPLLRLNIETRADKELLDARLREMSALLGRHASNH